MSLLTYEDCQSESEKCMINLYLDITCGLCESSHIIFKLDKNIKNIKHVTENVVIAFYEILKAKPRHFLKPEIIKIICNDKNNTHINKSTLKLYFDMTLHAKMTLKLQKEIIKMLNVLTSIEDIGQHVDFFWIEKIKLRVNELTYDDLKILSCFPINKYVNNLIITNDNYKKVLSHDKNIKYLLKHGSESLKTIKISDIIEPLMHAIPKIYIGDMMLFLKTHNYRITNGDLGLILKKNIGLTSFNIRKYHSIITFLKKHDVVLELDDFFDMMTTCNVNVNGKFNLDIFTKMLKSDNINNQINELNKSQNYEKYDKQFNKIIRHYMEFFVMSYANFPLQIYEEFIYKFDINKNIFKYALLFDAKNIIDKYIFDNVNNQKIFEIVDVNFGFKYACLNKHTNLINFYFANKYIPKIDDVYYVLSSDSSFDVKIYLLKLFLENGLPQGNKLYTYLNCFPHILNKIHISSVTDDHKNIIYYKFLEISKIGNSYPDLKNNKKFNEHNLLDGDCIIKNDMISYSTSKNDYVVNQEHINDFKYVYTLSSKMIEILCDFYNFKPSLTNLMNFNCGFSNHQNHNYRSAWTSIFRWLLICKFFPEHIEEIQCKRLIKNALNVGDLDFSENDTSDSDDDNYDFDWNLD